MIPLFLLELCEIRPLLAPRVNQEVGGGHSEPERAHERAEGGPPLSPAVEEAKWRSGARMGRV